MLAATSTSVETPDSPLAIASAGDSASRPRATRRIRSRPQPDIAGGTAPMFSPICGPTSTKAGCRPGSASAPA